MTRSLKSILSLGALMLCTTASVTASPLPRGKSIDASFGNRGFARFAIVPHTHADSEQLVPARSRFLNVIVASVAALAICATATGGVASAASGPTLPRIFGSNGVAFPTSIQRHAESRTIDSVEGFHGSIWTLTDQFGSEADGSGSETRGSVITQFDSHGRVVRAFAASTFSKFVDSKLVVAERIARDSRGRLLLLIATPRSYDVRYRVRLIRLSASGRLDRRFGKQGAAMLSTRGAGTAFLQDSTVLPLDDGRIAVALAVDGRDRITEFHANGTLDNSFAKSGRLTIQGEQIEAVTAATGGKLVLSILLSNLGGHPPARTLIRITKSGQMDPSWHATSEFVAPRSILLRAGVQDPSAFNYVWLGKLEELGDGSVIAYLDADRAFAQDTRVKVVHWTMKFDSSGVVKSDYGDNGSALAGVQPADEKWNGSLDSPEVILRDGRVLTHLSSDDPKRPQLATQWLSADGKRLGSLQTLNSARGADFFAERLQLSADQSALFINGSMLLTVKHRTAERGAILKLRLPAFPAAGN